MSRIGKKPIEIPDKVKVEIKDSTIKVNGPKGELTSQMPYRMKIETAEGKIVVKRPTDIKTDKSLHGLTRSLIANMITGVTEGYTKTLDIIGVGFKAQLQGKNLNLQLGFSHPVIFEVPEGVQIKCVKPTQILISGIDKELVGFVASKIRRIYPPEPYKGKGIRYTGEYVKKKVGKAATK